MIERDETDEIFHPDLYDISDVDCVIHPQRRHKRNEITVTFKSETDFNLMKYLFAIQAHAEQIEKQLNILEAAKGEH